METQRRRQAGLTTPPDPSSGIDRAAGDFSSEDGSAGAGPAGVASTSPVPSTPPPDIRTPSGNSEPESRVAGDAPGDLQISGRTPMIDPSVEQSPEAAAFSDGAAGHRPQPDEGDLFASKAAPFPELAEATVLPGGEAAEWRRRVSEGTAGRSPRLSSARTEPRVQIGTIEVVVVMPPAAERKQRNEERPGADLASRHYLRNV